MEELQKQANRPTAKKFPQYGYIGILLLVAGWCANWALNGLRSQGGFFIQWLGYIFFIDAIVYSKKGNSFFTDNKKTFIGLFLASIPFWWFFELINLRVHYWVYDGSQYFTDLEFFILASICFSTVIPAITETNELLSLVPFFNKELKWLKIKPSGRNLIIMLVSGLAMLLILLLYPKQFPYFLWISLYFILEPLNCYLGFPTLLSYTEKGNWTPVIKLFAAGLCCGFFWELWNYYSYPKWKYYLPGFDDVKIFEMPLAGYLGYLPFALELWAYNQLVKGLITKKTGGIEK
jgi:hypothetical protein